jgi:hypothetical protein
LHKEGADWVTTLLADTKFDISSFGLAEDRSMFVADRSGGIYLISDGDVKPEVSD